jgi:hypothetical protein
VGHHAIPLPNDVPQDLPQDVVVGIRPTDLHLANGPEATRLAEITVEPALVEELGSERMILFPIGAPPVNLEPSLSPQAAAAGDEAPLLADDTANYFTARLPARAPIAAGERTRLTLDVDWLYLFDPANGQVLRAPTKEKSSAAASGSA